MTSENVFLLPFWAAFLATLIVSLLSVEAGFRLGRYQQRHKEPGQDAPVGAMVGAMLGLLAFMLAFTFGIAGSNYEARRQLVLQEANIIGTTYLRAQLLPPPRSAEIQALLREYVDIRIGAAKQPDKGTIAAAIARSEELHRLLWSQAVALAQQEPNTMAVGMFIQPLNELIALHAKRVMASLRTHIPAIIWIVLYLLAIMAMVGMGYQTGSASSRHNIVAMFLTIAFSSVMTLTMDLDRTSEGHLIIVSQQAMIDLQQSLKTTPR